MTCPGDPSRTAPSPEGCGCGNLLLIDPLLRAFLACLGMLLCLCMAVLRCGRQQPLPFLRSRSTSCSRCTSPAIFGRAHLRMRLLLAVCLARRPLQAAATSSKPGGGSMWPLPCEALAVEAHLEKHGGLAKSLARTVCAPQAPCLLPRGAAPRPPASGGCTGFGLFWNSPDTRVGVKSAQVADF